MKQPIGYDAQLAGELYKQDYLKTSELGRTKLLFGFWPEFISRSVHAGLQVFTCSDYDYRYPG